MKWLTVIFRNFSIKLILQTFIEFLESLAKKTDNDIDDQAVELIRIILVEAKLL